MGGAPFGCRLIVAAAAAASGLGCSLVLPFTATEPDADVSIGDAPRDVEMEPEAVDEAPVSDLHCWDVMPAGGSELTHVATTMSLVTDRLCDLDGDGLLDNAIAELGEPSATFAVGSLNGMISPTPDVSHRTVVFFPRVADFRDLSDPETTMILFQGWAADDAEEGADDFGGDATFEARWLSLDECGEPLNGAFVVSLKSGHVRTIEPADMMMGSDPDQGVYTARAARIEGAIEAPCGRGEWQMCGHLAIRDLGRESVPDIVEDDLSFLEVLVAGGAALGVPSIPGIQPDVDLDGDGLERFALDESLALVQCIDGDDAVIDGRDCWQDERMADGFSINARISTVPARYGGPEDVWDGSDCKDPPDQSLWDGALP